MEITEPCALPDFLGQPFMQRWIAHPSTGTEPANVESVSVGALSAESGSVGVAIGPEGGFSVREITDSIVAGWTPLQLGSRILRIETAAMAVAAQLLLGR